MFIPLTKLCRDSCHYCTFAHPPRRGERAYLTPDEVLAIAERGRKAGCHEALFTLGDKPELRYRVAREELAALGADDDTRLSRAHGGSWCSSEHRTAAARQSRRHDRGGHRRAAPGVGLAGHHAGDGGGAAVSQRGGPHFGSPDKAPALQSATIEEAGRQAVPFTSGILIGIGETRAERIEALLALRDLHERYGHIQEIIIQNFRAKPATRMAAATRAVARRAPVDHRGGAPAVRPGMNIQAPPNLQVGIARTADRAPGINDWGGVSPVTPDHVNPEAPWPELVALEQQTAEAGKQLVQRLAIYPPTRLIRTAGSRPEAGAERCWTPSTPTGWRAPRPGCAGTAKGTPRGVARMRQPRWAIDLARASSTAAVRTGAILAKPMSSASSPRAARTSSTSRRPPTHCAARRSGDTVTYVVNRNINYTNVCYFRCQFCAFSKGKMQREPARAALRSRPRRDRAAHAGSLGARRHRGLPAGRHPSRVHGRDVSRHLQADQVGRARHARARLLAAGGLAGRGHTEAAAAEYSSPS